MAQAISEIAPTVGTQDALKLKSLRWENSLIVISSSQNEATFPDRFDPLFILEHHIFTITSDKRFYKLPQALRF